MTDIATLLALASSGIGTLKGAADLASSVRNILSEEDVSPKLKAELSQLLDQVIAAKQINIQAFEKFSEVKAELDAIDTFSKRMDSYALYRAPAGAIVYRSVDIDPAHEICPNCVEDRKISFLQGPDYYKSCERCKASYKFDKSPPIRQAPVRRA